jgi:hypothetical protein
VFNFVNLYIDFRLMRFILIIFLFSVFGFACVKPKTKNPVPVIGFEEVTNLGKVYSASLGSRDTAVLVISYEDGDGDIFVDNSENDPNMVLSSLYYNTDSSKFLLANADSKKIKQPDDGYYKGKSIKGKIFLPLSQYRTSDDVKIIKFELFMVDMKKNKSNVVTSPAYTLNF